MASAVAPLSPTPSSAQEAGTKRNAPDEEGTTGASPKRQRKSIDDLDSLQPAPEHRVQTTNNGDRPRSPDRRKSSVRASTDEGDRKRNKRLFGGLLSTLSQKPANTATQRRRQEIEARKKEEVSRREAELDAKQQERTARLYEIRRREQRRVDEKDMHVRNASVRARAGFLMTETEPRIYWRPWEMGPEEEARVQRQIEDVEGEILREMDEFEALKRRWRHEDEEEATKDGDGAGDMGRVETTRGSVRNAVDDQVGTREGIGQDEQDAYGMEANVSAENQETHGLGQEQAGQEESDRRHSIDEYDEAAIDAGEDTLIF